MLPSLIRAMTKKTWKYWWVDRKDYLPKELGNLAKNVGYELTKWYKELEGLNWIGQYALSCSLLLVKQPLLCGQTF